MQHHDDTKAPKEVTPQALEESKQTKSDLSNDNLLRRSLKAGMKKIFIIFKSSFLIDLLLDRRDTFLISKIISLVLRPS